MDNKIIELTDKHVDLKDKKIGDVCEITLKVKKVGENIEPQYDMPCCTGEKEKKPPKKYVRYRLEVLDAKQEKNDFFDEDKRKNDMFTKNKEDK